MKNNKNGFTLTELLTVIVILGIVATIAIFSVSSISKNVKNKQYENLVSSIETAALKYANDTGSQKIIVQNLIDEGYLTADDDGQNIYDPRDNEIKLNCHYVTIDDDDAKYDDENSDCDFDAVEENNLKIFYRLEDETYGQLNSDTWLTKKGQLYIPNATLIKDIESYSWIMSLAPDDVITSETFDFNKSFNQINIEVSIKSALKNYSKSAKLNVDLEKPLISSIEIASKDDFTQKKEVTVTFTDSVSGIYQYIISKENNFDKLKASDWQTVNEIKPSVIQTFEITDNSSYYIWVKDKAGNISESKSFTVDNVDSTPPECTYVENNTWTNNSVTISWGCKDNFAGCTKETIGSKTFSQAGSATKTYKVSEYVITDKAGNKTTCKAKDLNVYFDKTKPTCTLSGDSTSWTSGSRTIKWGCSDGDSGCNASYSGSENTYTSSIKTDSLASYTIKDNAGNSATCSSQTVNVYLDNTAPSISSFSLVKTATVNNASTKASGSFSDSHSGVSAYCITSSSSSSSCSWKSTSSNSFSNVSYTVNSSDGSGATTNNYLFVKDNVGNVSSGQKFSYTLYKYCTTLGGLVSTGTCSKSCGGGTRTDTYSDYYYNYNCSKTGVSCNTQACCTIGSWSNYSCSSDGYVIQRRSNTCATGGYETQTTNSCCTSYYGSSSWGSCNSSGYKYASRKYYSCGSSYTDSSYDSSCCTSYYGSSSWGSCNSSGYQYASRKYYSCGSSYTDSSYDSSCCTSYYGSESWGSCNSSGVKYSSRNYYYCGSSYTDTSYNSSSSGCVTTSICDIDGSSLFGTYKGSISGNYGTWYSSLSFSYTCYNGNNCTRSNGYERVCATDKCGQYRGYTAKWINDNVCGSGHFARFWCSCAHSGEFSY